MNENFLNEISVEFTMPVRIDAVNSGEIEKQIDKAMQSGAKNILFDFSDNNYMASSGIRVILSVYKKTKNCGGKIALVNVKPDVRNVLEMTGYSFFQDKLPIMNSINSARSYLML